MKGLNSISWTDQSITVEDPGWPECTDCLESTCTPGSYNFITKPETFRILEILPTFY